MKNYKVLAINPGSTSTKIALFQNEEEVFSEKVVHAASDLAKYREVNDQLPYRRDLILEAVGKRGYRIEDIDAFVGRGGGLMPCEGGTYRVNEKMLDHAKNGIRGRHPAVLGSQLAAEFASLSGGQAFIVDSPEVDEFWDKARLTGIRGVYRSSSFHALNQKRTAMIAARELGGTYDTMNFVVAHIGGGVSVAAHQKGKVVDAVNQMAGDSPMAPTRCGLIPMENVIELCFSGKWDKKSLHNLMTKSGGLTELLGTSEMTEIAERSRNGDKTARFVREVFVYQIGKYIGQMAAALSGKVDAVLLTGGISYDQEIADAVKEMVQFIAPVRIYPGEFEMEAMSEGALRVLRGEETAKEYTAELPFPGFPELGL